MHHILHLVKEKKNACVKLVYRHSCVNSKRFGIVNASICQYLRKQPHSPHWNMHSLELEINKHSMKLFYFDKITN